MGVNITVRLELVPPVSEQKLDGLVRVRARIPNLLHDLLEVVAGNQSFAVD
eukprot:CAMPEP_0203939130 /NCGR_PEP_ID=MMETSP0359-20131031/75967_1 /ASSEMBLY_ACC=CAM_ASM_000338 /TAXON_ID=268821 /ORGANISM="Scrippsiella Hangoei, Strain SHTV-5" /LENGTH=50 /DNA_ID=CAMNT_0050869409 /DNA_START=33 /DNA_END=183 /DNA_ORIENTATION=+